MSFNENLRILRGRKKMTQAETAAFLGVSTQTYSKWERGLLLPDLFMLPKIAGLFEVTADSLLGQLTDEGNWRSPWEAEKAALRAKGDKQALFDAYVDIIRLHPKEFELYPELLQFAAYQFSLKPAQVEELIGLCRTVERDCTDDAIRLEVYRPMTVICGRSPLTAQREMAGYYWKHLPLLSSSREIYAPYAMEGEALLQQERRTLTALIDRAECTLRRIADQAASVEEKCRLYRKAAALYEILLDEQMGSIYEGALMVDYDRLVRMLTEVGNTEEAADYAERLYKLLMQTAPTQAQAQNHAYLALALPPEGYGFTDPRLTAVRAVQTLCEDAFWQTHYSEIVEKLQKAFPAASQIAEGIGKEEGK